MKCFGLTDIGKKRKTNQDSYQILELSDDCYILAVCDGMGGANGGEIASSLAIEKFFEVCKSEISPDSPDEDIVSALHFGVTEANKYVYAMSLSSAELNGMGTTLVAAMLRDNGMDFDSIDYDMKTYAPNGEICEMPKGKTCAAVFTVNVGDSRVYLSSDGELKQLTKDHSYVQFLIDNGELEPEKADRHPRRNVIMRAIGIESTVIPDVQKHIIQGNGSKHLLLASDGLYSELKSEDIQKIICSNSDLAEKCSDLIAMANKKGGHDNITAILAEF